MTPEQLEKANQLREDIKACENLLESFTWQEVDQKTGRPSGIEISRHPVMIIRMDECDGGKEDFIMPGALNDDMIAKVKIYAKDILEEATAEFEAL